MQNYYCPVLLLVPEKKEDIIVDRYSIVVRKWDVTTFDLATLQTKHKLHLVYELMSVFLRSCNCEINISALSHGEAEIELLALKAMLYIIGCPPFILPFISTHSVNEYAGINSRDSELLKEKLPDGFKKGFTSHDGSVEVWPFELTFQTIDAGDLLLKYSVFKRAIDDLKRWRKVVESNPVLKTVQDALITAPMIIDMGQSLLHIWTAIESLFPTVNQELSFRLAIYLTQLYKGDLGRKEYFSHVRKAYTTRSKVAHGSSDIVTIKDWMIAWGILTQTCHSILDIGKLPNEEDLINDFFSA